MGSGLYLVRASRKNWTTTEINLFESFVRSKASIWFTKRSSSVEIVLWSVIVRGCLAIKDKKLIRQEVLREG